jgi:hypothetical protein
MDIVEKVKTGMQKILQEIILPELEIIKIQKREIKTTLQLTNRRLDDIIYTFKTKAEE